MRIESDEEKKLVLMYRDESTYNINKGETWMWGKDDHPALLQKMTVSSVLVSDFVKEHNGYLALTPEVSPISYYPYLHLSTV